MSIRETFLGGVAVPSLESRILDDFGVKILHAVAKRQRLLLDCTTGDLPKRTQTGKESYGVLMLLEAIGLVKSHSKSGKSNGADIYTLTEKGWDFVGDKPLHL